jgi:hypothetical protein
MKNVSHNDLAQLGNRILAGGRQFMRWVAAEGRVEGLLSFAPLPTKITIVIKVRLLLSNIAGSG